MTSKAKTNIFLFDSVRKKIQKCWFYPWKSPGPFSSLLMPLRSYSITKISKTGDFSLWSNFSTISTNCTFFGFYDTLSFETVMDIRGNIFWNGLYCSSFLLQSTQQHRFIFRTNWKKNRPTDTQTTKLEDKWTHVLLFGKLLINVAQIEHTNDAGHSHRIQLPCAILTACS